MRLACLVVALAGCLPEGSFSHKLNEDVTYLGIVPPFDSAEACVRDADDPRTCSFALTFCKSGIAARRIGAMLEEGTYTVDRDETVAHAFVGFSEVFFDLEAMTEVGSTMKWEINDSGLAESFLFETINCAPGGPQPL